MAKRALISVNYERDAFITKKGFGIFSRFTVLYSACIRKLQKSSTNLELCNFTCNMKENTEKSRKGFCFPNVLEELISNR